MTSVGLRISFVLVLIGILHSLQIPVSGQPLITNTPVNVQLPTSASNQIISTPQSVSSTETPTGLDVFLEANAPLDQIDVRDFPENGAYLGSLVAGQQYRIVGQYYSWLFFEYATGPNGRAWIYRPIVRIIGDPNIIPFVDPAQANLNSQDLGATQTQSVLQQTPGFAETGTAQAREIVIPIEATDQVDISVEVLPTYTPPADIVPILLETPIAEVSGTNLVVNLPSAIPPIVPILILFLGGGIGILSRTFQK